MKIIEPPVSPAAGPFWDATRNHEFVLPWCVECAQPMWYPRDVCPRCLGSVALIDLAEGVRMMSNVVNVDATTVAVGLPVTLTWEPLSDGRNLPQFEPR
jgi:uncharacterized OB-fold protein